MTGGEQLLSSCIQGYARTLLLQVCDPIVCIIESFLRCAYSRKSCGYCSIHDLFNVWLQLASEACHMLWLQCACRKPNERSILDWTLANFGRL